MKSRKQQFEEKYGLKKYIFGKHHAAPFNIIYFDIIDLYVTQPCVNYLCK